LKLGLGIGTWTWYWYLQILSPEDLIPEVSVNIGIGAALVLRHRKVAACHSNPFLTVSLR